MPRGQKYSPDEKLRIAKACSEGRKGHGEEGAEVGADELTVRDWVRQNEAEGVSKAEMPCFLVQSNGAEDLAGGFAVVLPPYFVKGKGERLCAVQKDERFIQPQTLRVSADGVPDGGL